MAQGKIKIVRQNFLKTSFTLIKIKAWKNPPKKLVTVEKTAQINVQLKTLQKALPNDEPSAPLKLNSSIKFLIPT